MNCYHNTMNKMSLALHLASEWHDGQTDLNDNPYILHPLTLAMQFKDKEDLFCVAMLHDVVEDCGISLKTICDNFGDKIAEGVDVLTHKKGDRYVDYIANIKFTPWEVIKLADLKHNMDVLRYKELNEKDCFRLQKYIYSYKYLNN